MPLTHKQEVFVSAYLVTWNATEAARRAGYSARTARAIGAENLTKPDIAAAIQARISELAMSADEVLTRLGEQGRAAYSAYLNPDGELDFAALLADGKGHLIKGTKQTKYGLEIEFYDAQTALVWIGKKHGLFVEKQQVAGSGPNGEHVIRVLYGDDGTDTSAE